MNGFSVALVCMPFASAERPSIQIGLLTAIAEQAGFPTSAYHFNLDLAARLTPRLYESFCQHRGHMSGDWLFAPAAFGACAPRDEEAYLHTFPEEREWLRDIGRDEAFLADLRQDLLPGFVEDCLNAVDWDRFNVVGFTSTFQQSTASLALARRIKTGHPHVTVVFGGANLEGEMGRETARAFPFVDYVVSGEGDVVFPELLTRLADGDPFGVLPGVIANRPEGLLDGGQANPIRDLNGLPVPDYMPYFERAGNLGLVAEYQSIWTVPFESARGCWWGQKHHCTFCGLNGLGMAFRPKTPERVLDELAELSSRHRISAFTAVDNILDLKYIPELFTHIAESKTDYLFFYEVKANLTRQQIQTLYRGGVRRVQPGIESMSTHVLQAMRKGSTMLQNVRCLKWCSYYNIRVDWNLLWGFPGETEEDYAKEREVLRAITHLDPPIGRSRIWLERFSPYYADSDTFPVRNISPEASYQFVYPQNVDLAKIAYFFDYDMADTMPAEIHVETDAIVDDWQTSWHSEQRHRLSYRRTRDCLLIDYDRGPDQRGTIALTGAPAAVYDYCGETMRSVNEIHEFLRTSPEGRAYALDDVRETMEEFCRSRLMVGDGGRYLSLALPVNPNW